MQRAAHTSVHSHAVVIGGGIAGLLAARVLADHVSRVTIVERDRLPMRRTSAPACPSRATCTSFWRAGDPRAAVSRHRGRPDSPPGAPAIDWLADLLWLTPDGWGLRYHAGIETMKLQPELLELTIRRRLLAAPNIAWSEGWEVAELLANERATAVTGVRLRRRADDVLAAQHMESGSVAGGLRQRP